MVIHSHEMFFANPQLIHIAVELVVLMGLVFWFHMREKRLVAHLRTTLQRVDALELRILHLESLLTNQNAVPVAESYFSSPPNSPPVPTVARVVVVQAEGKTHAAKPKESSVEIEEIQDAPSEITPPEKTKTVELVEKAAADKDPSE
jgi:hypothetical protein